MNAIVAEIAQRAAAGEFSGAFLVARDGRIEAAGAHGLANRADAIPNQPDTRFNLASLNKMFTAVTVARLIDAGRLRWDDPVATYLGEDWLAPEVAASITIDHLLSHTSGLGNYFNAEFERSSRLRFRVVGDYRPLVAADRPAFAPGSSWRYSNSGYMLLGAVIERVCGDYFEAVREHVYRVAGMHDTDCFALDAVVPRLAIGYTRCGDEWVNNLFSHVLRGGPAGGGFSTAEDLLRFERALRDGALLCPATFARLVEEHPLSRERMPYGRGFMLRQRGEQIVAGHRGTFAGISTSFEMHLVSGCCVIVLANQDAVGADAARWIDGVL